MKVRMLHCELKWEIPTQVATSGRPRIKFLSLGEIMGKKCLIIYSSLTGNTEKVALRFESTFEKNGWECDIFKIRRKAEDVLNPLFDINNYDFMCVGSGVIAHLPYSEILSVLRRLIFGFDPRIPLRLRGEDLTYIKEPMPDSYVPKHGEKMESFPHKKIVFGSDCKKAVTFITYSGFDLGPKEAEPSMQLLALEVEHLGFKCIGQFCCPGYFVNHPTPATYHGDIRDRPNEKDLLKAEMFIEEKLEEIADRTA
jgi:hypothetical protein